MKKMARSRKNFFRDTVHASFEKISVNNHASSPHRLPTGRYPPSGVGLQTLTKLHRQNAGISSTQRQTLIHRFLH